MKPPLPLLPPHLSPQPPRLSPPPPTLPNPHSNLPPLPPLGPNNPFPMLSHEMFCDHCQRTQVIVDNFRDEMHFILSTPKAKGSSYHRLFDNLTIKDPTCVLHIMLKLKSPVSLRAGKNAIAIFSVTVGLSVAMVSNSLETRLAFESVNNDVGLSSRGAGNDVVSQPRMATRVLQNPNMVMTNAMDKNDMQSVSSAVVNDGFQTSFGESTLLSTMNPSFGSKVNVEEGVWSTRVSELKNPNSFDVEETLWSNKGNGDSSIAIPTSSFPSLAEVSRFYTNSGGESRNKVNLVPSMFDTNSKSICGMEGITPTGWTFSERNDLHNKPSSDSSFVKSVDINIHPTTYAGATGASNSEQLKSKVNFRPMVAEKVFDDVNMSIPRKVVKKVSRRFENTLYGYFIGKQIAFPIVEYYARNNWAKHGLKRIMMNSKGFFFFKFDTHGGLEAVLEGGPWMIYNSSIILKKWSIGTSLLKEELTQIPIWVKLRDVPLQVFKDDGISLIASYLGKPIMLDSYTSLMCKDSWGRSSFARCLIEINSATDFKESITIGIPDLEGPGFTKETIRVEYEWQPPRCHTCNIFGHTEESCPKMVVVTPIVNDNNDGFQQVEFNYQPRAPSVGSNGGGNRGEASSKASPSKDTNVGTSVATKGNQNDRQEEKDVVDTGMMKMSNITTPNPFAALDEDEEEEVVNENNLSVCAILESHVDVAVVYNTCKKVCDRWKWTSNGSLCPKDNYYVDRRALWNNLVAHASLMRDKPWVLLGDFNVALNLEDHSYGGYEPNIAMQELKECVQKMEVMDVNATGLHFTWNQKPKGYNGILKKIDRIMGDLPFTNDFSGNLHERVNRLHNPSCLLLRDEHALYLLAFKEASLDDERFLRKKSKIEWLNAGDSNTAYFHKIVKSKCVHNRIEMVRDSSNVLHEGNTVISAFVSHYEQFLGLEGTTTPLDDHGLFSRVLSDHNADFMVREVSDSEIKGALFSIGDDKPPGPDGFNAAFFKKSWDIVGDEVTIAIRDFFSNGKLLKELNHTIISLIPKVSTPTKINDCHSISCCNVLFKCISKIIANRIKGYLGDLVSINQSAFVSGRRISDNILLTQELMRNYHRKRGPPRCAFKVDIQKAYDTVDWGFLRSILVGFGFHPTMVDWIMGSSQFCSGHMDALEEFKNVSGLVPSIPKSIAFFCNVPNALKANILSSMPFAEGTLPVRYLGVPLISSRLLYRDCKVLIEKLEREMKKGKVKVAWEAVCLPQREGGLGIRRIEDFNIALMATHIWCILINKESLWVQWIHSYKLKGRSFRDVPCLGDVSWG
ncbi:sodium/hydrogen exchanger 6 [Tanacetum coccineum]